MKIPITTNHLGNVLVTVSARPRLMYDENDDFLYKESDVTIVNDYYPFGMLAQGRHWQSDSYRFGFNGKENDNEINGWQDYGERMYNRLIARFPTPDPLIVKGQQYPELSPYQFASLTPIMAIDLDGLEAFVIHIDYSTNKNSPIITVGTNDKLRFGIVIISKQLLSERHETYGLYDKVTFPYVSAPQVINEPYNSNNTTPYDYKTLSNSALKYFRSYILDTRLNAYKDVGNVSKHDYPINENKNIGGENYTFSGQLSFNTEITDFSITNVNIDIHASNISSNFIQNLSKQLNQTGFPVKLNQSTMPGNINIDDPLNPNGISLSLSLQIDYIESVDKQSIDHDINSIQRDSNGDIINKK